ncbi:hypothetical protein OF83DRAFT_1174567 [Amylostereum chailletii]|nr:hypothetical protein OF83DRAFT_1174567 [Amylostereum chailletii]
MRDYARKSHADPLASIPAHIKNPSSRPSSLRTSRAMSSSAAPSSSLESRLTREFSERERAQALIRRKQKERERLEGSATPSTVHGGYGDVYNRVEVEEAHQGWGRKGWQRDRELKDRRWSDDGRARRRGG